MTIPVKLVKRRGIHFPGLGDIIWWTIALWVGGWTLALVLWPKHVKDCQQHVKQQQSQLVM